MENHPGVAVENGSLDEVIVMMIQGKRYENRKGIVIKKIGDF